MFFQPRFRGSYGLTFGFALGFIVEGGVGDGAGDGIKHGLDHLDDGRHLSEGHAVDEFVRVLFCVRGCHQG